MTTTSRNDQRESWWARHRRWVVPAALAPIGYLAFALVGGQLTSTGNDQGSIGLSLLGLLFLLAAFAAPIVFGIIAIRRGHDPTTGNGSSSAASSGTPGTTARTSPTGRPGSSRSDGRPGSRER